MSFFAVKRDDVEAGQPPISDLRVPALLFACKESASQRAPRQDADSRVLRKGRQIELCLAPHQRIIKLRGAKSRPFIFALQADRFRGQPRGPVREAGVANLALPDQIVKGLRRLFNRRVWIESVGQIDIDAVRAQAP